MKTPVIAFAGLLLLASGALAQNQPAIAGYPGMPMAAPPLMSATDATTLGSVSPQEGPDIANRIKLRGYIDMSYSKTDIKGKNQDTLGVKSVDLDFLFDFSPVTAEIHVQHENNTDDVMGIEQAFVNYAVNPNFSLTFGRQTQLLGFEGDEATDQYLSTRTYFLGDNFDLLKTDELLKASHLDWSLDPTDMTNTLTANERIALQSPAASALQKIIPALGKLHHNYNDGIRANFNAGRFGLAVGLYDGLWGSESEDQVNGFGDGEWGIDVQAAYVIIPGLEARIGYARHNDYHASGTAQADDIDQLNFWLSYQMGSLTLAGEYNDYDVLGVDGRSWMLLANYSFNSRFGAALRYSEEDFDDTFDTWKISFGPSLLITENLMTRIEYSYAESDIYGLGKYGGEREIHLVTVEGLFTF